MARGRDLQVELRDGRALLTVQNWFDGVQPSPVPAFVFENTARWAAAEVSRRALERAATAGDDRLFGAFDLENILAALEGDDVVVGGSLPDTMDGGPGIDWMDGGGGADRLLDQGGGVMRGGAGDDRLTAQQGFFLMSGGEGADAFTLNGASAVILPGTGENDVSGTAKHVLLRLGGADGDQRIDLEPETLTLSLDGASARMAIGMDVSGDDVQVSAGATTVALSAGTLATASELRLQTIGDRVRVYDLRAAIDRARALNTLFPGEEAFDFSAHRDDYLIAEWTDRAYGGELAVADVGREADDGGAETSILSLVRASTDEDAPALLVSSLAPVFTPPTPGDDLIVVPAGVEAVRAGTGDDTIYGPDHSLIADGEAGDDYIAGQEKEDYFSGGEGDDILSGGGGHDALRGGPGHNLILGGAGNDWIFGSTQNDFIAAGPGEDAISLLHGRYVIAFNGGDGHDSVAFLGTATAVLSLGDSIRYDDVRLRRNGDDLELGLGEGEGVTLQDWYSDFERTRLMALQFFEGGDDEADQEAVLLVDFLAGVDAYDRWATTHATSAWASLHSLLDAGAHDVDQSAYGGGIALAYARGSDVLMSASVNRVREVLAASDFATAPQSLGGIDSLRGSGLTLGG
ncbi:MAG: hypothetical protein IPK20_09515 [Betaproteobacteria bacterium]|nr:hypothetical protein [Betaproteobacteria bacterium]